MKTYKRINAIRLYLLKVGKMSYFLIECVCSYFIFMEFQIFIRIFEGLFLTSVLITLFPPQTINFTNREFTFLGAY